MPGAAPSITPDIFSEFPARYRSADSNGGITRLHSFPLAYHDGTLYVRLHDKIVLANAATLALQGTMGEEDMAAPAAHSVSGHAVVPGIAVYAPAQELYVCHPPERTILVFGIGGHRRAGQCVRRLGGVLGMPRLIAVGGENTTNYGVPVNTVERFDPFTNVWEEVAPMATARSAPRAASLL